MAKETTLTNFQDVDGWRKPDHCSPTVLVSAAQGAVERIVAAGVDPVDVLSAVGLQGEDLSDPSRRIALLQYCQLFEIAARKTARVNFGLEFGASVQPQQFGLFGYVAISTATLGLSLRKFEKYLPVFVQAARLATRGIDDDMATVEYAITDQSIPFPQQDAELTIGMLVNVFRHALGPWWIPRGVHLAHSRPPGRTRYEELLGVRPLFGQGTNRIIFRRSELDCPMPRRDATLLKLLEPELQKQLAEARTLSDVLWRVRQEITLALQSGKVNLDHIARRCGYPPWTLKRRLHDRGLTFQELVGTIRHEIAVRQLRAGKSVGEVALMLGFSQVSAFSRVFRQWTGLSPRNFLAQSEPGPSR